MFNCTVALNTFTWLCNSHHHPSPELFLHWNSVPIKTLTPYLLPALPHPPDPTLIKPAARDVVRNKWDYIGKMLATSLKHNKYLQFHFLPLFPTHLCGCYPWRIGGPRKILLPKGKFQRPFLFFTTVIMTIINFCQTNHFTNFTLNL